MKNKTLKDSFTNAYNGLRLALFHERNMRIHIFTAILCVLLGIIFCLDALRWAILMIAIGLVFITELFNTAIENMVDMITSEFSVMAKTVKDIAAGTVLIASVIAVILGILVFIDPIINLIVTLF